MSRIRADRYTNREGTGAPTFSEGVNVVGVTSMSGDLAVTNGTITGPSQLTISGITSSISDTAVDVFVYDTSKDSDGGDWRYRTQNTSWYNETLNTATRGSRKEFPSVAVIVATASNVTIYDGDDPDLPMWMVFDGSTGWIGGATPGTLSAKNGILAVGGNVANQRLRLVYFLKDYCEDWATVSGGGLRASLGNFLERNSQSPTGRTIDSTIGIVDRTINDVAMTVLPNAPIDDATGLPIPTIAVATDGGLSIIKDDGTVSSPLTGTNVGSTIDISDYFVLYYGNESQGGYYPYNVSTASYIDNGRLFSSNIDGPVCLLNNISSSVNQTVRFGKNNEIAIGMDGGLNLISGNLYNALPDIGMIAYSTSDYNTGYMQGDIKLATLSDTDATNQTGGTVADRSVNNTSVNVTGTITRTAVATGADLVGYSGFSASNYLQQPYNSGLAPGTGAYSVTCWIKTATDGSNDQYIFDRGVGGSNSRNLLLVMQSSGRIQFYNTNSSGTASDLQTTDMPSVADDIWHQIVGLYDGSAYRVYIDGKASSVTNTTGRDVGNDGTPPLTIGTRFNFTQTFDGNLALFRYSKTAPSPEQIKKMYEDEKFLFQGNSQATLYGSSDAVTALAYDDTTDLLHVGTSSGRSEFQGLRRINNTTVGITSAISASNELVAEQ